MSPARCSSEAADAAVARQIAYGRQRRVPWGISESAFAAFGANSDYHYQSFGVPGLGAEARARQGPGHLAVFDGASRWPSMPAEAVANFRVLANEGAEGPWGFYDAVDYTPDRVPDGERRVVVFSYMTHHQGMTMVALANVSARPSRAAALPTPAAHSLDRLAAAGANSARRCCNSNRRTRRPRPSAAARGSPVRSAAAFRRPMTATPRAHLLSNGQYHRDAHQRRRRLQQLPRPGDHALAGRRDARRLGTVHLPARPGDRSRLVGHPSADACRRRHLRGDVFGRQGRVSPPRRQLRNASRSHDLAGMQCRSAADDAHQSRPAARQRSSVTSYAEVVLAATGGDAGPSGVQQTVRRNRIRARLPCTLRAAAAARCHLRRRLGRPRARRTAGRARTLAIRNGSRPLSRPRTHRTDNPLQWNRCQALRHDRPRARCDLQSCAPLAARCRRIGEPGVRHRIRRQPRRGPPPGRSVSRSRASCSEPSKWRGPTARSRCDICTRRPPVCSSISGWSRRCLFPDASLRATGRRHFSQSPRTIVTLATTASRATIRSCCCGSPTRRIAACSASCFWPMNSGTCTV